MTGNAAIEPLPSMYCRQCHYDLRGCGSGACPECGTAFDLQDSATFLDELPTWQTALAPGLRPGVTLGDLRLVLYIHLMCVACTVLSAVGAAGPGYAWEAGAWLLQPMGAAVIPLGCWTLLAMPAAPVTLLIAFGRAAPDLREQAALALLTSTGLSGLQLFAALLLFS